MYTGPALQPNLWDIMVRARMASNLLIGDLQKAFLQIGLKTCDRDAFRFLFNINGREEHFRFSRLPFAAEASPFVLGETLLYHYDQQPNSYEDTLESLKKNTYVDNLMKPVLLIFLRIVVFFNFAKSTRFYRPEILIFVWGKNVAVESFECN